MKKRTMLKHFAGIVLSVTMVLNTNVFVMNAGEVKALNMDNGSDITYNNETIVDNCNFHNAVILSNGDLYCWGNNSYGQIGNGTTENQLTPIKVLSDVASVWVENNYTVALTTTGDLYCWGNNSYGQIGNGTTENQLTPIKVLSDVVSVKTNEYNISAIITTGDLYCWGNNSYGQIGTGSIASEDELLENQGHQLTPVKVLSDVVFVEMSKYNISAITTTGDLYCWGNNSYGQIGNGSIASEVTGEELLENGNTKHQLIPVKVLSDVAFVEMSEYNTSAITTIGDLYCWGNNSYGQIGNGTIASEVIEDETIGTEESGEAILEDKTLINEGNGENISENEIPTSEENSENILEDEIPTSEGNGEDIPENEITETEGIQEEILETETIGHQLTPIKILSDIASVEISKYNISAITTTGDLYCWGNNSYGQIGNGSIASEINEEELLENETIGHQLTPIKVLNEVSSVEMSEYNISAITTIGDLYCWGNNSYGQIGNGNIASEEELIVNESTGHQLTPIKVLSNVVSNSMNVYNMNAITTTGDLYCWGNNSYGQIGNGNIASEEELIVNESTGHQLTPIKVLSNVVSNSMNVYNMNAITTTGDLYCWGNNSYGQVGNGTILEQTEPIKVLENVLVQGEFVNTLTENGEMTDNSEMQNNQEILTDETVVTLSPLNSGDCYAVDGYIEMQFSTNKTFVPNISEEAKMVISIGNETYEIIGSNLINENGQYVYNDDMIAFVAGSNDINIKLYTEQKGTVNIEFFDFVSMDGAFYNSYNGDEKVFDWTFEVLPDIDNSFSFGNISVENTIPIVSYLFPLAQREKILEMHSEFQSLCFGMAVMSSAISYTDFLNIEDFGDMKYGIWSLQMESVNEKENLTLLELLKIGQVSQFLPSIVQEINENKSYGNNKQVENISKLVDTVKNSVENNCAEPVIIAMTKHTESDGMYAEHAVLACDWEEQDDKTVIMVYDSNCVGVVNYLDLEKIEGSYTGEWVYRTSVTEEYRSSNVEGTYITFVQPIETVQKIYLDELKQNDSYLLKTSDNVNLISDGIEIGNGISNNEEVLQDKPAFWVNDNQTISMEVLEKGGSFEIYGNNIAVICSDLEKGNITVSVEDDNYNISVISDNGYVSKFSYIFYYEGEVVVADIVANSLNGNIKIFNNADDIQITGVDDVNVSIKAGTANNESELEVIAEKELISLISEQTYAISALTTETLYQVALPNTDASDYRDIYKIVFGVSSILFVILLGIYFEMGKRSRYV